MRVSQSVPQFRLQHPLIEPGMRTASAMLASPAHRTVDGIVIVLLAITVVENQLHVIPHEADHLRQRAGVNG